MKLEHILLGVLLRHPSTGYDLKKYLDAEGRFLRPRTQMSQVYRSLGRMEDDGWVRHEVRPRPGAQDYKIYRATDEGATIFLEWLKSPYHPGEDQLTAEFRGRLSFAGFLTVEEILRIVDAELAGRREQVARNRYRDRTPDLRPDLPFDVAQSTALNEWVHRRGAAAMDAHIAACADLRRRLLDGHAVVDGELELPELAPADPGEGG